MPEWFTEKWGNYVHLSDNGLFPMSSKYEKKYYDSFEEDEFLLDVQKMLLEAGRLADGLDDRISLVLFHECDGLTKVVIYKDKIVGMEPTAWKEVKSVEHNYCYGCSDVEDIKHGEA